MTTVGQIDKLFETIAPKENSESWDNDGIMLLCNKEKEVKRVLCALEVRKSVIDYAINGGFDLIVTHHPFIFRPLSRLTDDNYENVYKLMKADISVLSYHTRLDSAEGGVNDCLAAALGLTNVIPFGGENGVIGRIGQLQKPVSAGELGKSIKQALGCESIMCACENPSMEIKTIGLVGGGGKDFMLEAFSMGADAYVSSEIAHHLFIAAKESGRCVYDCGHYYTENVVVQYIKNRLIQSFGDIYVEEFDVKSPYFCI